MVPPPTKFRREQRSRFPPLPAYMRASVFFLVAHARLPAVASSSSSVEDDEQCTLYLAPSSIPNSGLGTYTGVSVDEWDAVAPPELVINLLDWPFHTSPDETNSAVLSDYDWAGTDYLSHMEARKVQCMFPGMGAAINSHPGLYNVREGHPKIDSAGLRRWHVSDDGGDVVPGDPGAGAFTYYHSLHARAERPIQAGSELFAHYSDPYFIDRTNEYGHIPLSVDFEDADRIVAKFHKGMIDATEREDSLTEEVMSDLWETIRDSLGEDVRSKRLQAALPKTLEDVRTAVQIGGGGYGGGSAHLSLPSHVRSLEWLEKNGMCMDSITPGRSTIKQAGRGGFASRSFAEGDVVLPLPLLQVNRNMLEMRTLRKDPDFEGRLLKGRDVVGHQLILNYCLGHPDSSLLLYPYSTGSNYVNHAKSGEGANVKLRWHVSQTENDEEEVGIGSFHRPEWLNLDAPEVIAKTRTGLLMELVATRDITKGEEILLDYGQGWAEAWEDHVKNWAEFGPHGKTAPDDDGGDEKVNERRKKYTYPHELDEDKFAPLKTHAEQKEDPYAPNVVTACFYNAPDEDSDILNLAKRRTIKTDQNQTVTAIEIPWREVDEFSHPTLRPCRIVSREERVRRSDDASDIDPNIELGEGTTVSVKTTELRYTALMKSLDNDIPGKERHLVYGISRDGIVLVDGAYLSDQHLRGAFRREIGVPDDLFPMAWRDLA